ncbi:MAG: S41 family peptidase [Nitrospirota bacterium]|jgi:carboxyl-terminal processing protease
MRRKRALALLVTLAVVAAISLAVWAPGSRVSAEGEVYEGLKVFTEVLSVVKTKYVEETNTQDLIYDALAGMLKSLDPHSGFMTPDMYKEMQIDTRGKFGGLGIQISMKDGVLTVIAPIEDTPAWRAGIEAGDKIIKIDGESTQDMSLQEAVNKMRGPKGTSVVITIFREGEKEPKDYAIVRDIIEIKSVDAKVVEDGIGYVRLKQFQEKSAAEMEAALQDLVGKEEVTALILDLRNNPGGLLTSSIDVANLFLPSGKLVVYTKGRAEDRTDYRTVQDGPYQDIPMVVLVNQGSASASEIVAGALKDWRRAIVLGTETFGKGSVQSVIGLSDGSGLRLTTARYYTPKGQSIQNTGITPDIVVKLKSANGAAEHVVVREKDLKGHLENEQAGQGDASDTGEEKAVIFSSLSPEDDTQLQRAIDLLKAWETFKKLPDGEFLPRVENVPAHS